MRILKGTLLPSILTATLILTTLAGCDSQPEDSAGEQELITLVRLHLTDDQGNKVTATAEDADGDGADIQITTVNLVAGRTYTGTIELRDDINGDDLTGEVEEESAEHQFFYTPEGGIAGRVTVTITDRDANDLPVGLEYEIVVSSGAAAAGMLNVVLGHYDDVVKDGTTRSPESDVDIDFPVAIAAP